MVATTLSSAVQARSGANYAPSKRSQAAMSSSLASVRSHTCQTRTCSRAMIGSSKLLSSTAPFFTQRQSTQRDRFRGQLTVAAASKPDIPDRVVASLPYLLPLFDGLRYGKFFFLQFPAFKTVLIPISPLAQLYFSVPFAGLALFFGVYLGIINNYRFSRFVRYNAMQAVLLDIILILPGLLESVFRPPTGGPGLQVYISGYNTIWLFVFFCVAYGIGSCMTGTTARLPIIADAADAQVR